MTSFLFTAMPSAWGPESTEPEWLEDMAERFAHGRPLETSPWSTRRKTGFKPGDRAYLLVQGSGPRGIIGSGHIVTGEVSPHDDWRGGSGSAFYVDIAWDAFLPMTDPLPTAHLDNVAPDSHWQPMSSGNAIKPQDDAAVEQAWIDHLTGHGPTQTLALTSTAKVEQAYRLALGKVRLHQRRFRALLLLHYPAECAYCGLDVLEVLEAAHLVADADGGDASVENGRLLCPNHHRALDAGLLQWSGGSFALSDLARPVPPEPGSTA